MSLPSKYSTCYEYFEDALVFLKENQWIYNYPNVDILVQNVFDGIPREWMPYFRSSNYKSLKNFISGTDVQNEVPESFRSFMRRIIDLSPTKYEIISAFEEPPAQVHGIGVKKQHEIECLSPIVAEICEEVKSHDVIDIGAGLGYLSFLLADKYDLSVLSIEGSEEKIKLALKNRDARKKVPSNGKVIFDHHFITNSSIPHLEDKIEEIFVRSKAVSICGLHACADLSTTILNLFLKLDIVKSLVIMPCCYHRLTLGQTTETSEHFVNFPVSSALKEKFDIHNAFEFLRRPFLRLACQQTAKKIFEMDEIEQESQARSFLLRAVLQKAAKEVNCKVTRLKRKTGKTENSSNFKSYLETLHYTHQLVLDSSMNGERNLVDIRDTQFKQLMSDIWAKYEQDITLIEVISALQASIQSICENILLLDRVQFLRENGVECSVRKITDDKISPRCYALIAVKQQNVTD